MKEKDLTKRDGMELSIFKAAEQLFVEKGYNGTSTTEIAAKAGCNQALIHYYYRTKANLFQIILKSKINYMVSVFDYIDNKELSFTENLTKTIEMHFDALTKDKRLPMFVLNELKNDSDISDIIKETFKYQTSDLFIRIEKVLDKEIRSKRIREVTAFDLVVSIASLNIFVFLAYPIIGKVLNLDEKGVKLILEQRKKDIVNMVLNSLKP